MIISKISVKLFAKRCRRLYSRHRSPFNFLVNLTAGLAAYTYLPKKPSIDIYPKDLSALPPAIF
ncbi:hypothetical protein Ava_4729 [Trichormus variabilis ATCC 29413]|uniref:Uncharacterized protein n=1 Tax=Trichormus variabilis (strain ATCC 29413 / PCC 7937) TaxID=240292 RepID=Q3M3W0_TRIV2|nr:hypothetical protein Ava_4729 [Trichormus variabilis ATCC 29413]